MDFKSMTKLELEAWARENLDIELDRRLSKNKLVKQVTEAVAAKELEEIAAAPTEVVEAIGTEPVVEDVVEELPVVENPINEVVEVPAVEEIPTVEEVTAAPAPVTSASDAAAIEAFDMWVKSGRSRPTFAALSEAVVGTSIEKAFKGWNVDRRSPNYRALVRKIDGLR